MRALFIGGPWHGRVEVVEPNGGYLVMPDPKTLKFLTAPTETISEPLFYNRIFYIYGETRRLGFVYAKLRYPLREELLETARIVGGDGDII